MNCSGFSGTIYTARDADHKKLDDLLNEGKPLPIELDGAEYVVLMAPEEDEDDEEGSVVIMKIEEQDGEDVYVSVDYDDVAQKVFDLFLEYLDEEEDGEE